MGRRYTAVNVSLRPISRECYVVLGVSVGIICGFFLGTWSRNLLMSCSENGLRVNCCPDGRNNGAEHFYHVESPINQKDKIIIAKNTEKHNSSSIFTDPPIVITNVTGHKQLLLVGVMTAKKYLNSRALAVYQTWGRTIPGKIIFFSSEGSEKMSPPGMPVIGLPGVDDSYPPQKKSFLMLKYMYEHYGHQFEWIMRADDDVYIKADKLADFLYSLNSSLLHFIGQTGLGNKDEVGLLNLNADENFCMGGPGILFSMGTLKKMVPHVSYCLKHLYTTHEDVEIGRCVQKFAGISCTWSFEMQQLFHHNHDDPNGSFAGSLNSQVIHKSLTLHPVKNPTYLYRLHEYMLSQSLMRERHQQLLLMREIQSMNDLLKDRDEFYSPPRLSLPPSLLKFVPRQRDELLQWEFISKSLYSHVNSNPKVQIPQSLSVALDGIILQVLDMINRNARQRGRTIEYRELLYGYKRVDPLHGADYILDLLLVYKKHKGKKMTIPVRRHAYLQQTFTAPEVTEDCDLTVGNDALQNDDAEETGAVLPSKSSLLNIFHRTKSKRGSGNMNTSNPSTHIPTVHFIVPLADRHFTFINFLANFEQVCLQGDGHVSLAVMFFSEGMDQGSSEVIQTAVSDLHGRYPRHDVRVIYMSGSFSRERALKVGADLYTKDDLLCFMDIDIHLTPQAVENLRFNAVPHKQVFFPIVFSQYDPDSWRHCLLETPSDQLCDYRVTKLTNYSTPAGYWRDYGYGIASLYKNELLKVGGISTPRQGPGMEDVDLFTRFLQHNITVFRAPDPGMIHVYHTITCDPDLPASQLTTCENTRAASLGAAPQLAQIVYSNPDLLNTHQLPNIQQSELDQINQIDKKQIKRKPGS